MSSPQGPGSAGGRQNKGTSCLHTQQQQGRKAHPSGANRGEGAGFAARMMHLEMRICLLPRPHQHMLAGAKSRNRNGTFGCGGWEHRACRQLEHKLCGQQSQTGKETKRQGNDSGSARAMARSALIPPCCCCLSPVSLPQTPRPAQTCPNSTFPIETLPLQRAGLRKMQLKS